MKFFEEQAGKSPEKALAAFREGLRRGGIPHPILECRIGRPVLVMSYVPDYMEKVKSHMGKASVDEGVTDYAVVRGGDEDIYIFVGRGGRN